MIARGRGSSTKGTEGRHREESGMRERSFDWLRIVSLGCGGCRAARDVMRFIQGQIAVVLVVRGLVFSRVKKDFVTFRIAFVWVTSESLRLEKERR